MGHNYKALAITYDPSPQIQGKIPASQEMKRAQSSQEFGPVKGRAGSRATE